MLSLADLGVFAVVGGFVILEEVELDISKRLFYGALLVVLSQSYPANKPKLSYL